MRAPMQQQPGNPHQQHQQQQQLCDTDTAPALPDCGNLPWWLLLQIALLVIILLLLPKTAPHAEHGVSLSGLQSHAHNSSSSGAARYAIVLDAGSTGSRVHVFKFEQAAGGGLKLISDTFEQLKPGLSSFADDPQAAANSLKPLMQRAVETVPQDQQASTPVSLKATAGLRLLPGDKADKILDAVREFLATYPFSLAPDAVAILGGQDEGGFAWLTLNYLLGRLGGGPEDTVAAIDLGGGSVQEAFALTTQEAASAPEGYVMKLKAAGKQYNVYVHSYLGYGLMAGRAKLIEEAAKAAAGAGAAAGHPCFPSGYTGSYKYAGKDYAVAAAPKAEFGSCAKVGLSALQLEMECGAEKAMCSFNGAWRGKQPSRARSYYVSSYFWDRAQDSGVITDAKAISWPTSIEEFGRRAAEVCGAELASLPQKYPSVKSDAAPFFCLDLTYCHTLLIHGFKLPPTGQVTLVKQVEYNGQSIEAAWPLGAALNDLSG